MFAGGISMAGGKGGVVHVRGRPIRVADIRRMRLKGKTYREIANKFRISTSKAWEIGEGLANVREM